MKTRARRECELFGLAVRTLREQQGLSQEALAELAELHRTYIGSVERGQRNLSLNNIHVIASALGVAASDLLAQAESYGRDRKERP